MARRPLIRLNQMRQNHSHDGERVGERPVSRPGVMRLKARRLARVSWRRGGGACRRHRRRRAARARSYQRRASLGVGLDAAHAEPRELGGVEGAGERHGALREARRRPRARRTGARPRRCPRPAARRPSCTSRVRALAILRRRRAASPAGRSPRCARRRLPARPRAAWRRWWRTARAAPEPLSACRPGGRRQRSASTWPRPAPRRRWPPA